MTTITFNSYKGGTGKTMTSLNFSAHLAKEKKVALIDFDFLGPALFSVFKNPELKFINEAIYSNSNIEDVLVEYNHSEFESGGGKLIVGIADPRPQTIQGIHSLTEDALKAALEQTIEMQAILEEDLGYDYIVIDTGPGLRRDVANAIFISDCVALVMKPTRSDLEGTKMVTEALIKGYSEDKAVGIIFNRALNKNWQPHSSLSCADADYHQIVKEASEFSESSEIQVYAWLDCLCDIARSQADRIFVLNYPDHPYAKSIQECSANILASVADFI